MAVVKDFIADEMGVEELGKIYLSADKTVYLYKAPDPAVGDGEMHFVSPLTGDVRLSDLIGGGGPSDYAGKFEQDDPPTALQIPDGKWGWWWDTNDSQMSIVRNRGGTMYTAEAGPNP